MIKELFLPQTIKGHYLFGQRIVGFDINKTHVNAVQLYLKNKSITVEKYFEIPLEAGTSAPYAERVSQAIAKIASQLDPYDSVHSAISSSNVIFKELRLPFLTYEKLAMVVPYEIEPLLPFSPGDAVIDFIVTRHNVEQAGSEVLVAAVQNQHIAQHLELFANSGITPTAITVDLLALYGLYMQIPRFATQQGVVILIDIGQNITRIAYIQDGQLRFIRSLNKGTAHITKAIGDAMNMQPQETTEHVLRYGFEKSVNQKFLEFMNQEYGAFCNDIQLIIQSFIVQNSQSVSKIVLTGWASEIKGIASFFTTVMQTPCQILQSSDIADAGITMQSKGTLPNAQIMALSIALPSPFFQEFNLRKNAFALESNTLINKQLIVAGGLLCLLFILLGTHTYLSIRTMSNAAYFSEKEALDALLERKNLHKALEEGLKGVKEKDMLEEAITIAQEEVKKQEALWFAFAGPARASMLKYLLELTNKIDKDALGFVIESLTIADNTMTIKAQVKNHEALKLLEKELTQSPLFKYVPRQEQTNFTMKITLATNREEQ